MVSSMKEKEERHRSLSPIWKLSPDVRKYHHEQAEGSGQQSNNANVMGMLVRMEQEMKERDKQLKLQLQLRDEYMDVELKRR